MKTRPRSIPQEIAALLRDGDVVVVKGSKKMFWVNKFVPRLLAACRQRRKLAALDGCCFRLRRFVNTAMHGQDLLGLRMKTIIKAFRNEDVLGALPAEDGATKPRDRAYLNVLLADRAFQHRSRFWHLPRRS